MVKNRSANGGDARDMGSIPGSGRSPGEGNGNTLQYSCLGNPMDKGAWQATVHRVTKQMDTTKHTHTHNNMMLALAKKKERKEEKERERQKERERGGGKGAGERGKKEKKRRKRVWE